MRTSRTAAVVVHHRSYDTLTATVASLLAEGLAPSKLVVVDNSEDPSRSEELRAALPEGVNLLFCANAGYGAAVNLGVAWHAENTQDADFVLVSTHEARPEPGALLKLVSTLAKHPSAAVVGPALVTGADSELIWSLGGYFSRVLGLPRHHAHKAPRRQLDGVMPHPVSWLDGAFLLFRKPVIEQHPIDEGFFLYMEETDHQQLLQRLGWKVILQPQAVVWQSSGGTPSFYQTRNIQLFQAKNGSRLQRIASAPYVMAVSMARDLIRQRGTSEWASLVSGWKAGWSLAPFPPANSRTTVFIVNPLGGALAHYTKALEGILRAGGAEVVVVPINEPSVAQTSRLGWIYGYLKAMNRASTECRRVGNSQVLITWPVLGFLDLAVAKIFRQRSTAIVYHDPKPLVRSVGSGELTGRMISAIPTLPRVIVHSSTAAEVMRRYGLGESLEVLAHPMLPPNDRRDVGTTVGQHRPTVRVLGQFKQDRDLDALHAIAHQLGAECTLEIVGRGWPAVAGWRVDSRFVSEQELDELIRSSDVIVIPYKRFYQSGIAIRALEAGTPIVGRAATSLADIYDVDSSLLVSEPRGVGATEPEAWSAAVRHAIHHGSSETKSAADKFFEAAVSDWRTWIREETSASNRGSQ